MITEQSSTWKILSKHFLKSKNLNKYFSSNHKVLSKNKIPPLYLDIHNLFMKYYKPEPNNLLDILNQPLLFNKWITSGNNHLINDSLENKDISKIKDLLNDNCEFENNSEVNLKYNTTISFLDLLKIKYCTPKTWKTIIKTCNNCPHNIPNENMIYVRNICSK